MRVAIVLGTRPEIVKMSPIVRACQKQGVEFVLVHTGQHYSYEMDQVFFEQLDLPRPHHNLEIGSGSHGEQTGKMLAGLERVFRDERPTEVLVQGDTNSVVAGALAAAKLGIKVGHVEAGLRSFDRTMPEEINRVVADHVSDHLFAPTETSAELLRKEGLPQSRIFVTGNTIVDAVLENRQLAATRATPLEKFGIAADRYVLLTAHRAENVDNKKAFQGLVDGARAVGEKLDLPVLYPIHPRARKMMGQHGIESSGLILIEPLDFLTFLHAQANARIVLTDSGGVQEETCILGIPCVTLRENTERPETIVAGGNVLAGTDPKRIVAAADAMLTKRRVTSNPFGDGHAAERILKIIGE